MGSLLRAQAKGTEQIWATKGGKRHCIAKRTMSIKKVFYVIFFTNKPLLFSLPHPKGNFVNARFYKGKVLHKLKKYFLNRRPATGLRGVRLLHDNASSHKAAIVREYLKQEKAVELSPDLAHCDFFLFPRHKKTPRWKKISNAQKSRFGYFSVSEQYTRKRL